MQAGSASDTAIAVATYRAAHLHLFDAPKIHEDTTAIQMIGAFDAQALRARLEQRSLPAVQRICAYFALRHRYSEDRMREAIARGVKQIVLLGAGLDTFAVREPALVQTVRFFEIDHPDSQAWKLNRLLELRLSTPGVQYVPLDFEAQSLRTELARMGLSVSEPTFFAWLGVTQYISEASVFETLSLASSYAAGSEIVFDIILPFDGLPPEDLAITTTIRTAVAARGEPWVSFFRPEQLSRKLCESGFSEVYTLTPTNAEKYYAGQPPNVTPLHAWQLMSAVV